MELWAHVLSFDSESDPWIGVALSRVCAASREAALASTHTAAAQRFLGLRVRRAAVRDWGGPMLARAVAADAAGLFRWLAEHGNGGDTRDTALRLMRADEPDALAGLLANVRLDLTFVAHHALIQRAPRCFARAIVMGRPVDAHRLAVVRELRFADVPVDEALEEACGSAHLETVRRVVRGGALPPGAPPPPLGLALALALEVALPRGARDLLCALDGYLDGRARTQCALRALATRSEAGVCHFAGDIEPRALAPALSWLSRAGLAACLRALSGRGGAGPGAVALTNDLLTALVCNPDARAFWDVVGSDVDDGQPEPLLKVIVTHDAARVLAAAALSGRADLERVSGWLLRRTVAPSDRASVAERAARRAKLARPDLDVRALFERMFV